jgi:hypothetical protein
MHKSSRPHLAAIILFAISVLACKTPFDGMTPIITGTIRSHFSVNGTPGIFVYEDGATENDCFPQRAAFTFGPDVTVLRDGAYQDISLLDISLLKTGQRVSVFGGWPLIKPCVPTVRATGIIIY